ncbi:dipeptide epimerase [Oceanicoccus sagamiensis]|uniref:Dipeptide epimerase n=1 Tax=Oceanicoccus sagamiensis TaxID=716816 RepID=A0A1X9NB34_9GAMM|nr:dipeptide epimerase [Oceanicoccus sagamiensis]ARN75260.1 dipeptide epimerase [Oceanicoccus sagamiensis]
MKINIEKINLPYKTPFSITGYTFNGANTIRVTLVDNCLSGAGEAYAMGETALGIFYEGETMDSMALQLESVLEQLGSGVTNDSLQSLLPRGGARNAFDCALWDLKAKCSGRSIWELLNLKPKPLKTVSTIGIDTPGKMGAAALLAAQFTNLKVKLSNDDPIARLEAVRAARPDANIIVDINQGWSFSELKEYLPAAEKLNIAMIEQPLPRGADEELEDFKSPIPLGADESCLDSKEYEVAKNRYDVINVKLEKCGGLTDALKIVELAKRDGKGLMVGNMGGSSLSMAPSFVIGQFCEYVDIDGPLLLVEDVAHGLHYGEGGVVDIPSSSLWG